MASIARRYEVKYNYIKSQDFWGPHRLAHEGEQLFTAGEESAIVDHGFPLPHKLIVDYHT